MRSIPAVSDLTAESLADFLRALPGVDAVGLEARAADLGTRSIKTTSKAWAIDTIIKLIDLTTLEGADTPGKVRTLVAKALVPDAGDHPFRKMFIGAGPFRPVYDYSYDGVMRSLEHSFERLGVDRLLAQQAVGVELRDARVRADALVHEIFRLEYQQ